MNRFTAALQRAVAWLRRNPSARADALELAAAAIRKKADSAEREGNIRKAERKRGRATVLELRAAQLRKV
jgi:hypothetical protein